MLRVAVKAGLSLGLVALLLAWSDVGRLWALGRNASIGWLAVAAACYASVIAVSAWRWGALLKAQGVRFGTAALSESFLVATFFNNFLPSNIGGDVVRVADTAPFAGSKTLATTVVLLDRLLGLLALLAVAAVASALAASAGVRLQGIGYIWIALVAIAVALLGFLRFPEPISRAIRAAAHGRAASLQTRLHNLRGAIERFALQPVTVWQAFAGAVIVQGLLVLFYVCAAKSLSVPLPLIPASVIVPVSLAVQMAPVSINGFGVREAVFAFFFTSLGFDVSSALTLSLGSAGLIMLFSLSGGGVFLLRARGIAASPPGPTVELSS
jgi:glycosyltransferase 2 family protein